MSAPQAKSSGLKIERQGDNYVISIPESSIKKPSQRELDIQYVKKILNIKEESFKKLLSDEAGFQAEIAKIILDLQLADDGKKLDLANKNKLDILKNRFGLTDADLEDIIKNKKKIHSYSMRQDFKNNKLFNKESFDKEFKALNGDEAKQKQFLEDNGFKQISNGAYVAQYNDMTVIILKAPPADKKALEEIADFIGVDRAELIDEFKQAVGPDKYNKKFCSNQQQEENKVEDIASDKKQDINRL